jgi:hypothetical protein
MGWSFLVITWAEAAARREVLRATPSCKKDAIPHKPRTQSLRRLHRIAKDCQRNQASTRTTQLYDRRREELSLDEVERIRV